MATSTSRRTLNRRDSGTVQEQTKVQFEDNGVVTDVSDSNPLPVELSSDSEISLKIGGEELVQGLSSLPVSDQRGNATMIEILSQLKLMNMYLSVLTNESFSHLDIERQI